MDLGLEGRTAIVCASSRGLGFACADALAREGVRPVINGRDGAALDEARRRMAETAGVEVRGRPGRHRRPGHPRCTARGMPRAGHPVNNNSGPRPGRFVDWEREDWLGALDANMLTPLAMIRLVLDGMVERRFGRIVNITSAMVKSPRVGRWAFRREPGPA